MIYVFGKKEKSSLDNVIFIGKNADYPSLENYLSLEKKFLNYEFTKNHLQISYFEDQDIFISRVHDSPIELRLEETLISKNCMTCTTNDLCVLRSLNIV